MLKGKGMYIWQVARTEGGSVSLIADMAVSANFTHVLIKIADGTNSYNISSTAVDLARALADACKARGVEPWGWHYVYGENPTGEANKAVQRVSETGVVGYVIDAEAEYELPGKAAAATTFMQSLRSSLPFFPVALSSFRYPSIHPSLPWMEFLSKCDYAMPQVYWVLATNPGEQLLRSLLEYRSMTSLPFVPTGSAYAEPGWSATASQVVEFLNTARAQNLPAANFWEWYAARQVPNLYEAIASYSWPVVLPPPPAGGGVVVRGRVWASALSVRSGPGSEQPIIGSLKLGTRVTVYNLHRAWVKISPDREQWVYSYYLDRVV